MTHSIGRHSRILIQRKVITCKSVAVAVLRFFKSRILLELVANSFEPLS